MLNLTKKFILLDEVGYLDHTILKFNDKMRKKEKRERSFKDNTQNKHATLTTRSVKDIQRYQKNKKKKKTEYGIQIWRDLDLQDGKNKIEENKYKR